VKPASGRRHVHSRSIQIDAYARDDGLWDIEARLVDTKSRDFELATGLRKAGDPIHEMRLRVTIDADLNVLDADAESLRVPYEGECDQVGTAYKRLVGLNLRNNFRRHALERLGGTKGCTHITELTSVLPTAAIQAFAGEVYTTHASPDHAAAEEQMPFQLDRCRALRLDGPAVAKYYPRWFRAAPAPAGATNATPKKADAK
jgi:hypothetical protein